MHNVQWQNYVGKDVNNDENNNDNDNSASMNKNWSWKWSWWLKIRRNICCKKVMKSVCTAYLHRSQFASSHAPRGIWLAHARVPTTYPWNYRCPGGPPATPVPHPFLRFPLHALREKGVDFYPSLAERGDCNRDWFFILLLCASVSIFFLCLYLHESECRI